MSKKPKPKLSAQERLKKQKHVAAIIASRTKASRLKNLSPDNRF